VQCRLHFNIIVLGQSCKKSTAYEKKAYKLQIVTDVSKIGTPPTPTHTHGTLTLILDLFSTNHTTMKEIYKVHIYFYFPGLSAHSLKLLDIGFAHWFTK